MRRVSTLFLLFLAAALVAGSGCARKKPVTPADTPPPAIEPASSDMATTEVTQPNPQTTDPVEDPLSGDLASLNEYLRRQGLLGDVYFDYDRAELPREVYPGGSGEPPAFLGPAGLGWEDT